MAEEPSGLAPMRLPADHFEMAAARWRLEKLSLREVEDFATLALMRGFDGPALRELAWPQTAWREVDPQFEQALYEMGMTVPTELEAIERMARAIALEVEGGHRSLLDGAKAIRELYVPLYLFHPERLGAPFSFFWALDRLLGDLSYCLPEESPGIEAELSHLLAGWLRAGPVLPVSDSLAPSLGGARVDPMA